MEKIEIRTLVDITNTRIIRLNQGSQLEVNQQRNFSTLIQCIELRSIVHFDNKPTVETVDIKNLGFGSAFAGKHSVWTFWFEPDRSGVYTDNLGDAKGLLIEDLNQVPIIKNLSETVNIDKAIFETQDPKYTNIIIKAHLGTV